MRSPIIRPAFKPLEGQGILDYDDETHRREIKHLLYQHFGEGRTVAADLLRIISSPGANPRVINFHDNHISSHYALYARWQKEKKEGIVVVDGDHEPKDDRDECQEQLDKLTLAVGKMGQNVQDLQEMMKVRDGIIAAGDVEPPDLPRIAEEELRSKIKELYPGKWLNMPSFLKPFRSHNSIQSNEGIDFHLSNASRRIENAFENEANRSHSKPSRSHLSPSHREAMQKCLIMASNALNIRRITDA